VKNETCSLAPVLLLATMAGLRTTSALAFMSLAMRSGYVRPPGGFPLRLLASRPAMAVLGLAFTGELLVDKHPDTPSRLMPPVLFGRALSGALAGAALFSSSGRRGRSGALLGAATAVVSAHAGYHLRAQAGEHLGLPDPLIALLEDATVLASGAAFLKSVRPASR
jgi:uncharacterized membrane protein